MWRIMALSLWACQQTEQPIAYEFIPVSSGTEIDFSALETEANLFISQLRDYHSHPIIDSYYTALELSDESCPTRYEMNGNAFWYGYCYSDQGLYFDGYLFFNVFSQTDLFGDGTLWDVEFLNASTDLQTDENRRIHLGGAAYRATGISTRGDPTFLSVMNGSFQDDGSQVTWLQEGQSPTLTLYGVAYDIPNLGSRPFFFVEGSLAVAGENLSAIAFDQFQVLSPEFGSACPQESMGTLSLRTRSGAWIDVLFDVEPDGTLSGECDGCGLAYSDSGEVGEICVDIGGLVDWRESPW